MSLRILVADDDRVNQRIAAGLCERLGHTVRVVGNGLEALEALREQPFDVVLMDVEMPGLDGREATRRIRSELPAQGQPWVVALTANDGPEDREACRQAGMDDHLTKPLRRDALVLALGRERGPARDVPAAVPVPDGGCLPVLDRGRLAELAANLGPAASTVLPSLLARYPGEATRLVKEARQALAEGRVADLHRLAHTLRGSGANLGLAALSAAARELETRTGSGAPTGLEALCDQLELELERALQALEQARAPGA
jgi:CheY-like chemotaxis protein